jgi:hypothetical protein
MRTNRLVLIAMMLIALAGCSGSEKTITGTLGERHITGTIVPSGNLTGATPSGITVRATGMGVEATSSADGSFTMTGLPAGDVSLQFVRTSDGINATLQVSAGMTQVTVALEKTTASVQGSAGGTQKVELEGLITVISPFSIGVMDASRKAEVIAAINSDTVIRKGQTPLTTADLEVGDRVHVRARVESSGSLTALEIIHQEGDDDDGEPGGPTKRELEGLILEVSPTEITVMDASSGPQTAAINDETVIRRGGTTLTPEDLEVGDRVHVRAKVEDDGSLTALEIILQLPA